jgi:hypothetical protein
MWNAHERHYLIARKMVPEFSDPLACCDAQVITVQHVSDALLIVTF